MSLEELASKYISSAEHAFAGMVVSEGVRSVDFEKVSKAVDWARAYLEDARYFREKKKFEISLTSVAYCEGLLDALRLLGAVSFEWPREARRTGRAK